MIASLFPFLVKNWRILGAAAGVTAFLVAGWYIHRQIYQEGYNTCQIEHKAAQAIASEQARNKIIKIGESYEKHSQAIIDKGDTGHGVGSRVSDVLDLLHSRQN